MILGCLINLALQPFMALPAPVYTLIRLLIGLLILLQFLNCVGFLGTYGGYRSEPFLR